MKIQEIINFLEEIAPTEYAEDFDNVGLLVGNPNNILQGTIITLDALETVID